MDLSHPRCGQYGRKPKSGLPLRPVFHRLPQRIQVCVWITALALPLERGAERSCGSSWRSTRDWLDRMRLAQLLAGKRVVPQVTEPSQEVGKYLESMKIDAPTPISWMN